LICLRADLKRLPEAEHRRLYREIVQCHRARDEEEARVVDLRETIQLTWDALRDLRTNGYTTSPVSLKWKRGKYSDEEKTVEEQLFYAAMDLRAKEEWMLAKLEGNAESSVAEVRERLIAHHRELNLREPGEMQWIPELEVLKVSDLTAIPQEERLRLDLLAKARVFVTFMVGDTAMRSDDCSLSSDFSAIPNIGCHAVTMHVPHGIKVRIHEYGYEGDGELASVLIPVYHGDAPPFTEYSFAGTFPIGQGRVCEGFLKARCYIEPDPNTLLTSVEAGNRLLPGRAPPMARVQVRKMMEIAESHDPNDPYMVAAIANVTSERGEHAIAGKFVLDPESEATMFAAIVPSEICKEIELRAQDIVRNFPCPTRKKPERRTKACDAVTQPPAPSFGSFLKSLFSRLFKRPRDLSRGGKRLI
jgi:hypothetical protein